MSSAPINQVDIELQMVDDAQLLIEDDPHMTG